MSSCVPWTFEDLYGDNPQGAPGEFDFNVWYELDFRDENYGPQVEIIGVTCHSARYDQQNARRHRPGQQEAEQLADWFSAYLDSHPDEFEAIKDLALQYSYVGSDEEPDAL